MLPLPDHVNRDDGTYLLESSGNDGVKVLVTSENWATLKFNTKSMSPEYFPSSYLKPDPTDPVSKELPKRGLTTDAKSKNLFKVNHYWDPERFSRVASLLRLFKKAQGLSGDVSGAQPRYRH